MSDHPLHIAIGNTIAKSNFKNESFEVYRDKACGGKHRLPLFSKTKSRPETLCNVDILITKNGKISVIIEIEEKSSKIPTHIFGKFFTSALAKYFIHQTLTAGKEIEMDRSVLFLQVVDGSGFPEKTSKDIQFKNIRGLIQRTIQFIPGNKIKYELILTKNSTDTSEIVKIISDHLR